MVVIETIGALVAGMAGLFKYNRGNFRFDWLQHQEAKYHWAKMRNDQFSLYRQDISDLCDLSTDRMKSYLFVTTVTSLISLALFYEGRVPTNTPAWLFFLWASSVTSAFLYLLLSQWFSIQASVHAQTVKTVLKTHWLRLYFPSYDETSALAPTLEDFETQRAAQLLRIPLSTVLLEGQTEIAHELHENGDVHFTQHFLKYQEMQRCWRSYEAFARVSLVFGTNQFLLAVIYTGIAYFGFERSEWAYWGLIGIFSAFGVGHIYMNLLISHRRFFVYVVMYTFSPVMAGIINALFRLNVEPSKVALPVMYALTVLMQLMALGFLVALTMETNADSLMPHKFATIQLIDVLGLDPASRPRRRRESVVADAVPRAAVVSRGLVGKGSMSFEEEATVSEEDATDSEDEMPAIAAESLPVRLFQSLSLVILSILVWGLIQSTLVAFGLTTLGWNNVMTTSVNRKA